MERDLSVPHHVQALERFLNISRLLSKVEDVMVDPIPTFKYSWNADEHTSSESILIDKDYKLDEKFIYDTSDLTADNRWMHDLLMSDSSDSNEEEEMNPEAMKRMLKKHKQMKKIRDKTRHQTVSYSGYSSSILASDNPEFHFEFPSLDYSNKTRREKRPMGSKRKSSEVEPLSISDMIDALHSQCETEEIGITPPQLLLECDGPCLKKPRYARTTPKIWKEAMGQVLLKANERIARLDNLKSLQSALCEEIKSKGEDLLKTLKPIPLKAVSQAEVQHHHTTQSSAQISVEKLADIQRRAESESLEKAGISTHVIETVVISQTDDSCAYLPRRFDRVISNDKSQIGPVSADTIHSKLEVWNEKVISNTLHSKLELENDAKDKNSSNTARAKCLERSKTIHEKVEARNNGMETVHKKIEVRSDASHEQEKVEIKSELLEAKPDKDIIELNKSSSSADVES